MGLWEWDRPVECECEQGRNVVKGVGWGVGQKRGNGSGARVGKCEQLRGVEMGVGAGEWEYEQEWERGRGGNGSMA